MGSHKKMDKGAGRNWKEHSCRKTPAMQKTSVGLPGVYITAQKFFPECFWRGDFATGGSNPIHIV
jgi:hypothetical protein